MSKFEYLNLTQKMIKIRKMVPKLIRKRYSEEVPYDFVRLDDIYEYLTPALTKYGVDFEVLTEKPTQVDPSGNQVYLIPFGNLWRYEADLKLCWVNADHPNEKSYSDIHVVGTNEVPDKAKGAAWSYGLKYYLLNKYNIVQANTEDPDMRGPAPDGDKTKKEKTQNKVENTKPDLSPKKTVSVTNAVKSESQKKEAKEKPEHPPKSGSSVASAEEIGQSITQNEKLTSKTVRNGNAVSGKQTVKSSEDSFDLEISPDEIYRIMMIIYQARCSLAWKKRTQKRFLKRQTRKRKNFTLSVTKMKIHLTTRRKRRPQKISLWIQKRMMWKKRKK